MKTIITAILIIVAVAAVLFILGSVARMKIIIGLYAGIYQRG